jgi:hypothetical protein
VIGAIAVGLHEVHAPIGGVWMTEFPADDDWVRRNSEIDPLKLHAIGVIAFAWNQCEQWLFHLYADLAGKEVEEAWTHAKSWDGKRMRDEIRALLPTLSLHLDGYRLITNVLDCHERCLDNRNSIVHVWTLGRGYHARFGRVTRR